MRIRILILIHKTARDTRFINKKDLDSFPPELKTLDLNDLDQHPCTQLFLIAEVAAAERCQRRAGAGDGIPPDGQREEESGGQFLGT